MKDLIAKNKDYEASSLAEVLGLSARRIRGIRQEQREARVSST